MKAKKLLSGFTSLALSLSSFAGMSLPQTNAAATDWKFDFGGNGIESGYTGVSAADAYSVSKGYGFAQTANVANVAANGNGALSDAVQFKSEDAANTFNVDLPKGLYEITVVTGNCSRTSIKMEGILQMMNLTGNNAVETVQIPVTDGQLNIQAVAGRANTPFAISAIEIKQINNTSETNQTIWLCGDSTVANYYNVDDSSQHGWGQFLGNYVSEDWQIRNMAASGQYAKGFVEAGQFAPIERYGKDGDIYIISIGINDTNYSNAEEYYATITDMVKTAKSKGMTVVLVKQQGRRGDLTRSPLLSRRWFGGQLDKIGTEQNVTVIDLFNPWQDFGLSVGYDGMAEYYAVQANGSADDLHQSKKGSLKLAELMSKLYDFNNTDALTAEIFDENVMYSFRNVNSGLYMEVADGRVESGANVQQWGLAEQAAYNTWRLKSAGDGYYYIYSAYNDEVVLDVAGNKALNGQNIGLYNFNGKDNQQFRFTKNADGSYKIRTKVSGNKSAVEVINALKDAGANIQQWEVNGVNCQDWIVDKAVIATTTEPIVTTQKIETATIAVPVETTLNPSSTQLAPTIILGDANLDGLINMGDVTSIIQHIGNRDLYELDEQGLLNADINEDGIVTGMDAIFIQEVMAGIRELPVYVPPQNTVTTVPTTSDPHYYAVDQSWSSGVAETANDGFTKTSPTEKSEVIGYLNLDNIIDSSVTFNVDVTDNGNYMTHIRFANGTDSDRKMKIYVNGNTTDYWLQSFTGTGAWTSWTEFGIVLPLIAGKNTIQFASATENGGPNLDYITLTPTDEPFAETYDPSSDLPPVETNKPTVYIAGDSTVQSYRASYAPQQGWGYYLADYFDDNVTVANHSIAGRSTKKFYDEGRWQTIVDNLKEGDYVMVQFAINDSGKSNADRYAPTCGDVNNPAGGSYEWYMTEFIKSAQAKGATPILVTTVIGMKAYSNGQFINSYSNYCDACNSFQLSTAYRALI